MRRISSVFPAFLLLTQCPCLQAADKPDGPREDVTVIGSVRGYDEITQMHVLHLLGSQGIGCSIYGSLGYSISVPTKDADRSIEILKNDLAKGRYQISLLDGEKWRHYSIPDDLWSDQLLDKKYEDVIRLKEFGESSDLGAALRHRAVKEAVREFPYVAEVKALPREYRDQHGNKKTGHLVGLVLVKSLGELVPTCVFSFQVWDRGKVIEAEGECRSQVQATAGPNKQERDRRSNARSKQDSDEPAEPRKR